MNDTTVSRMLNSTILVMVSSFMLSACGGSGPTPLEQLSGVWESRIVVQAITLDPSQPAPKPFEYSATLTATLGEGNTLGVTGICPEAPGTLTLGGSSTRPYWRGSVSNCASFPTLDCAPSILGLTSLDLELDTSSAMRGDGGGEVVLCGTTFPALLKISGTRKGM